jgi:transposase
MIKVEEKEKIRRAYYIEQKSIRQIAKEFQHGRGVVRKALASAEAQKYQLKRPRSAPVLGPYKARIDELLAENGRLPRKQRYHWHKIYQIIQQEGYQGSGSNLRHYIGQQRKAGQRPAVYLPLEFDPGQDGQVDWGEADVIMQGEQVTVQLFVMRLSYSRRWFMRAFPKQKQEAFFEGHVQAFHHFGGVPQRLSYDNLKIAVQRVLVGRQRQEQSSFVAFRSHYLFESHFCTPGAGHEKGGVEHSIGYVRRNFLVPLPRVASFEELNAYLLEQCHKDDQRQVEGQPLTILAAWQQEQPCLRPLPAKDVECCLSLPVSLTPYSQVIIETNRYSVPTDQAAQALLAKVYPFRVEIFRPGEAQPIACHPRCYGHKQDVFDPLHYLSLLLKRPGAFNYAKPIRRWREQWPAIYEQLLAQLQQHWPDGRGVREFIGILQLHQHYPLDLIEQAVQQALHYQCAHLDGVKLCLRQLLEPAQPPASLDLSQHPRLAQIGQQPTSLAAYDQLLEGASWQ